MKKLYRQGVTVLGDADAGTIASALSEVLRTGTSLVTQQQQSDATRAAAVDADAANQRASAAANEAKVANAKAKAAPKDAVLKEDAKLANARATSAAAEAATANAKVLYLTASGDKNPQATSAPKARDEGFAGWKIGLIVGGGTAALGGLGYLLFRKRK